MTDVTLSIIWGTDMKTLPSTYTFSTPAHRLHFLQGVEAVCNSENQYAHFVPHLGYSFDNGEIKEVDKSQKIQASPNERYIIWGRHPSSHTIPESFFFHTIDEAACFELGIKAGMGYAQYLIVPGGDYRFLDLKKAQWLSEEIQAHFSAFLKQSPEMVGNILVNPAGYWINTGWSLDDPIECIFENRSLA